LANITVIEEEHARAHIRFPKGAHTDLKLKAILRRYMRLPGIASVRMDSQTFGSPELIESSGNNSTSTTSSLLQDLIPKRRSLESWLQLSQGDSSALNNQVMIRGLDEAANKHYNMLRPSYQHDLTTKSQCINIH
jgi:hypothetical protein